MNKFWIVKLGALGDLVRTSFFFNKLSKLGIINLVGDSWGVIGANPYVNKIYNSIDDMLNEYDYGKVFSMEDCPKVINALSESLDKSLISGFFSEGDKILYTTESAPWNDMGINSRFGIDVANNLKKLNLFTFEDCHRLWFGCLEIPEIFDSLGNLVRGDNVTNNSLRVGFCPISKGRWKNKSLAFHDVSEVVRYLYENDYSISLIGESNGTFLEDSSFEKFRVNTPNIDLLKYTVAGCDIIITCDSLVLHIARGMSKPLVSFFGPTSAAEVSLGDNSIKVLGLEEYYCNYSPLSSFPSLSSARVLEAFKSVVSFYNEK